MNETDKTNDELLRELNALKQANATLKVMYEKDFTERKLTDEALKESQALYHSFIEQLPNAVFRKDREGRYLFVNSQFCKLKGLKDEDFIGKKPMEVANSELKLQGEQGQATKYANVGEDVHEMIMRTGKLIETEEEYPGTDEGNLFMDVVRMPVIDSHGTIIGTQGIMFDITERKRAKEALSKSEERYRQVIQNASDVIFTTDVNGNILFGNSASLNITGYSLEEFTKMNYMNLALPEFRRKVQFFYMRQFKDKLPTSYLEYPIKNKSGDTIWLGQNANLIFENDQIKGFHLLARDITGRKQAEEARDQERILLRTIIDNFPNSIFVKDKKYRKIVVNQEHIRRVTAHLNPVIPFSEENLLGKTDFDVYPRELAEEFLVEDQKVLEDGQAVLDQELSSIDANGQTHWELMSKIPMRDKNGEIIGLVGISNDITERKRVEEQLVREQYLMKMLMDTVPDHIYFKDRDSRFIKINKDHANKFGLSDPTLAIGKTDFDFFTEEHARNAFEDEQMIIRTGKPIVGIEEKETFPNGRVTWVSTTKMPLRNIEGNIIGTFGVSRDITERKHVEEALSESEERFRFLFNASPEAVMLLDPSNTNMHWPIVDCNDTACKMNGYTREELIGKSVEILNVSVSTKEEQNAYLERIKREGVMHTQSFHRHKDGHIFPIEITTAIFLFKGQELILGIDRDITERKLAEEALTYERNMLRALMDNTPDHIYFKDHENHFIRISKAQADRFGLSSPEQAIGKTDFDFFAEEHARPAYDTELEIIKTGKSIVGLEEKETWKDGRETWVSTTKVPLRDINGEIIGTFGISRDITERTRTELIIQRQNNQLQELNATKDKFFSIIAHDLRSPFHGFLSMTEMMSENISEFSAEEITKSIYLINQSAQNLFKLLQNLLEWAQVQNGTMEFKPSDWVLKEIVNLNIETIYQRAFQKGITILNEVPEDQKVYADENMVNTILRNLLSNAVKFTRRDGEVIVTAKKIEGEMVEVSVSDTGVGISEKNVKKLFKIEEKVSSKGTEGESSTGLGLLLCKEFVEKHGGKIWVESQENIGSTFHFTLPEL